MLYHHGYSYKTISLSSSNIIDRKSSTVIVMKILFIIALLSNHIPQYSAQAYKRKLWSCHYIVGKTTLKQKCFIDYWWCIENFSSFWIISVVLAKKSDEGLPNMIRVIKRSYSANEYPGEESHDNVAIVSLNIDIYFIKSSINSLIYHIEMASYNCINLF